MLFNNIKKFHLFSLILFSLLFICTSQAHARARVDGLLLSTFKLTLQDAKDVEENFNTSLFLTLEEQGFDVQISNTQAKNVRDAQSLAIAEQKYATLYGSITQIGKAFLIDAQYVKSDGQNTPIIFEVASTFPAESIAARITLATLQASNLPAMKLDSISEIRIEGNKAIDTSYITARLQTTEGGPIPSEKELNSELKRIWNTGYFQDINIKVIKEDEQNILLISLIERPIIKDILVVGSDEIDIDDIKETMISSIGNVLNEGVLQSDIEKVEELYRKEAYYNVQVNYTVEMLTDQTANLVFTIEEGNKLYITNIDFEGFTDVDTDEIQIPLSTYGFFSFITGSGALKEEELEQSAQYIGSYMINEGYLRSKLAAPEVVYEEEGIRVIFKIEEGPRFKLGDITFNGTLIADPSTFYEIIGIDEWKETNGYFSLVTMQEDVRRLTEYYNNEGYAFARVNMQEQINDIDETVDIMYVFEPSTKTVIDRVSVSGNYKTRDNVILRELRLADGDMYSAEKISRSQDRLYKTGYFKIVDMQVEPTEDPALANLNIHVEEDSTGSISGGIGYSSSDGAGVSASIMQNNLFGRGYQVGVDGYIAEEETNMNTYFYNPRVYDTNLGIGLSLYGVTEEWTDFDRDTLGGQLTFGYPLGEYTSARLGYTLDRYTIYNVDTYAAQSIKDYEGRNLASVLSLNLTRDTTNANFFPTRGTKAKISLSYGGNFLGGTDNFIKTTYEFGGYYSLFTDHILHARATYGGVFKNTDDVIPAFERIYVGGITTLRGYDIDDVSPKDVITGESIGADRVVYATFEYIWIFHKDLGLAVVPFFDYATAIDSDYMRLFDNEYFSTGLEVRWSSPMGDLRFAYGYPLSKDVYGNKLNSGRFEFSMGRAF